MMAMTGMPLSSIVILAVRLYLLMNVVIVHSEHQSFKKFEFRNFFRQIGISLGQPYVG